MKEIAHAQAGEPEIICQFVVSTAHSDCVASYLPMLAGVARSISEVGLYAPMSLPKLLYSVTDTEPLLPTGSNSASDEPIAMSSHNGATDSFSFDVLATEGSFTTEPFHRFGNAAAAHHPPAVGGSGDWLTGGVNGNTDPVVTKFGINCKERAGISQNSTRLLTHSSVNGKHNYMCRLSSAVSSSH